MFQRLPETLSWAIREKTSDHAEFVLLFSPLQVIPHKSIKESYVTFPCAEILFEHDNGQNREFRCMIEVTSDDTTMQICAITSIKEVNITEK